MSIKDKLTCKNKLPQRLIIFLKDQSDLGSWVVFHALFLLSADFFSNLTFSKSSFSNTIRVSNRLNPGQARRSVGPDLAPNCLQKLSADDTSVFKHQG